jgi:hypothetical protein
MYFALFVRNSLSYKAQKKVSLTITLDHSWRRAIIGSTFVALLASAIQASKATIMNNSAIATNVQASVNIQNDEKATVEYSITVPVKRKQITPAKKRVTLNR